MILSIVLFIIPKDITALCACSKGDASRSCANLIVLLFGVEDAGWSIAGSAVRAAASRR
jgi:hypothetical protein